MEVFRNNLIANNVTGLEVEFGTEASNPVWENNLVSGNGVDYKTISSQTGIKGNISGDPLFVDAAGNNFRLRRESPAIDAGTNMSAPSQDFERETRPVDGNGDGTATVDIGADELALGSNLLELIATSTDGSQLRAVRTVTIVDTTAPEINARFVDRRSGKEISSIDSRGVSFVIVKIDVTDACDTDPVVESVIGTPIKDGDRLYILGKANQLILNAGKISLKVTATDSSGNTAAKTQHLPVKVSPSR